MQRNDLCWCGSGKKYKKCHADFDERLDEMKFNVFLGQCPPPKKIINNAHDIEGIRKAGVINDGALDLAGSLVKAGVDTASIDKAVHDYIVERGGYPSCLNYEGFPKSCCISINEVVCHGIPSTKTILKPASPWLSSAVKATPTNIS
jgi:methionyl aminopeptidase